MFIRKLISYFPARLRHDEQPAPHPNKAKKTRHHMGLQVHSTDLSMSKWKMSPCPRPRNSLYSSGVTRVCPGRRTLWPSLVTWEGRTPGSFGSYAVGESSANFTQTMLVTYQLALYLPRQVHHERPGDVQVRQSGVIYLGRWEVSRVAAAQLEEILSALLLWSLQWNKRP